MTAACPFAHGPGTLRLGDREICRLGYGAMHLPGKDVWGPPRDAAEALHPDAPEDVTAIGREARA